MFQSETVTLAVQHALAVRAFVAGGVASMKSWRRVLPGALIGAAACVASGGAMAADTEAASAQPVLEEVVVTGTSIKQNLDNTSLPVTILTSEDIAKTGYTSTQDLIEHLPSMQGFVPASSSVNGGGGGITTAAIHSLPSKYTLTLIDGQRVAPQQLNNIAGGGFGVNISAIPLSAIERVEVLTDGASALYGADAVAGVVNFILKKNSDAGEAFYNINVPDSAGGGGWNAGIEKGFGNLGTDNYNILFTYAHDVQYQLHSSQRDVSRQGAYFPFSSGGQQYVFFNATSNTEPANVILSKGLPKAVSYNPYYQANGNCGTPLAFPLTTPASATDLESTTCRFNYAATVQTIPGSVRDSGTLKGTFKITDNQEVFGEVLLSQFDLTSQYAPPAQPLPVSPTRLPTLWDTYVVPLYPTAESGTLGYRAVSAGGRTDDYGTTARQIVVGWKGDFSGWSVSANGLMSHQKLIDRFAGGYLDYGQFSALVATGQYDPVMGTGAGSLKSAILSSIASTTDSDLKSLSVNVQHELMALQGGPAVLSLGAENDWTNFGINYSQLLLAQSGFSTQPPGTNFPVGGNYGQVPFQADRTNWGVFGEALFPVLTTLDLTGSVRYDSYARVHSSYVFSTVLDPATGLYPQLPPASLGNTFDDATYKVSFRWAPLDLLSFRGSYGTGFRAPALTDIAGAVVFNGATSGSYSCPFPGSPGCLPGSAQYDLLAGPNGQSGSAGLQPEKSKQWTIGARLEPFQKTLSLGADYWNVKLTQQIQSAGIAEQVAFANPQQYKNLFVNPYQDPAGFTTIALLQAPFNGGEANYSGVDWNFNYHNRFSFGNFTAAWTGTRMLTQNYTNYPGGPVLSDLGQYGPDQAVVFKTLSNLVLSLQTDKWTNTLAAHYKSGYTDASYPAGTTVFQYCAACSGHLGPSVAFAGLSVPSFTTYDFQTSYDIVKFLNLTAGIMNIANKAPPLSLQTGGGGNAVGFDGRYYDPTGRLYYFRINAKF
jgi:iron complex outermembrane receptor protein